MRTEEDIIRERASADTPAGYVFAGEARHIPAPFRPFIGVVYRVGSSIPHYDTTAQSWEVSDDDPSLFAVKADTPAGLYVQVHGAGSEESNMLFEMLLKAIHDRDLKIADLGSALNAAQEKFDELAANRASMVKSLAGFLKKVQKEEYEIPKVVIQDVRLPQRTMRRMW